MNSFGNVAYRSANRVSLSMIYVDSTNQPDRIGSLFDEAFSATRLLLDSMDPAFLGDWYQQFYVIHNQKFEVFQDDLALWSAFVGNQCEALQAIGLHQKTIATLGSSLAMWDRVPIAFATLADALNEMMELLHEQSNRFKQSMVQRSQRERYADLDPLKRSTTRFAHGVVGLAILGMAIEEAIQKGDPRDASAAALANFGGYLTCDSVTSVSLQVIS